MKPRKYSGTCLLCRETLGKKGLRRHLGECLARTGWPEGPHPSYIISIDGRHAPSFWMFVVARHDAMFCDLDALLQEVWMGEEDDGSSFTIQGTRYIDVETNKVVPLADRIEEGQIFYYTYGGYTPKGVELKLKVVGTTPAMPPEGSCCLVARNAPDLPFCVVCGDAAEFLAVVPGDEFEDDDDDEGGQYFCRDCLMDFDRAIICPFPNSPRTSACFTLDDMEAALDWYPPGCEISDLISEDMQEMYGIAMGVPDEHVNISALFGDDDPAVIMERMARDDIGAEIDGFLIEEAESGKDVRLSEDIVVSFGSLMYGVYEIDIDHWDAALLRQMLLEIVVLNTHATQEWAEQYVPVLCRFLEYMENEGRNVDAGELFPVLLEAEPEFIQRVSAERSWRISTERAGEDFGEQDAIIDEDVVTELMISMMADIVENADGKEEAEKFRSSLVNLLNEDPGIIGKINIRTSMVFGNCEEFCTRLDDASIEERCNDIVRNLVAHPDLPLMQVSEQEWSGAIVSVACEEAGLVREGGEFSVREEKICEYFRLTPLTLRSGVAKVKRYIADTAGQK